MDPIKQRIAIAEYLGYIDVREYVVDMDDDCLSLMGRKSQKEPLEFIEYYTNDLNAMHEAEKMLSTKVNERGGTSQKRSYVMILGHLMTTFDRFGEENTKGNPVFATAAQRAEAFLKTIGKWEDDSICFNSMFWKCKDEI
jgi:hypothetical protein